MFDTQHTLELTEESLALDDPKYPKSWLDKAIQLLRAVSRRLEPPPLDAKLAKQNA
jgi:hypothetical protein